MFINTLCHNNVDEYDLTFASLVAWWVMYIWWCCNSTWIVVATNFFLLCPKFYEHAKITKLNPNTPWMKQNYNKTTNIDYYYFLPSMNLRNPIQLSTLMSNLL
jgi:hypothetical protein